MDIQERRSADMLRRDAVPVRLVPYRRFSRDHHGDNVPDVEPPLGQGLERRGFASEAIGPALAEILESLGADGLEPFLYPLVQEREG